MRKIILIEPAFVLRSGIITLLRENFQGVSIQEGTLNTLLTLSAEENRSSLVLISRRLYVRHKELLEDLQLNLVFLGFKTRELSCVNYLKTNEQGFVSVISKALGLSGAERQEDSEVLTESEINVLKCVALGLSNKEIAEELCLSVHTVATHRKNITKKLDIKSVSGLTVYAILHKIVAMSEIKG